MKKDVGMTTAQKSKETRRMESLFCISSQQSLHIRILLHYNLKLPDVYVGIVGWIYRTKIPSFLFPYFFVQWSSLRLFSFHEMLFPLLVIIMMMLMMIKNKKIRNHEKVRFYYSFMLSLSASKILLHDKNVHKRQGKQS